QHTLQKAAGALLEHIGLFDVYAGQGIAEGKKSLAFNLRFRAPDRTLTADEASQARLAAISAAEAEVGAVLRRDNLGDCTIRYRSTLATRAAEDANRLPPRESVCLSALIC